MTVRVRMGGRIIVPLLVGVLALGGAARLWSRAAAQGQAPILIITCQINSDQSRTFDVTAEVRPDIAESGDNIPTIDVSLQPLDPLGQTVYDSTTGYTSSHTGPYFAISVNVSYPDGATSSGYAECGQQNPRPTDTPAPTATDTPVPPSTDTPVPTATDTPVPTATDTPVPTATDTPVPTATATNTPTATATATNTATATATNTVVSTATAAATATATTPATAEATATAGGTTAPTATQTATATPTPPVSVSTEPPASTFTPAPPATKPVTITTLPNTGQGSGGDHGTGMRSAALLLALLGLASLALAARRFARSFGSATH